MLVVTTAIGCVLFSSSTDLYAATVYTSAYAQADEGIFASNYASDNADFGSATAQVQLSPGIIKASVTASADQGRTGAEVIADYRETFRIIVSPSTGEVVSLGSGYFDMHMNLSGNSLGLVGSGDPNAWGYVDGDFGLNIDSGSVSISRSEDLSANMNNGASVRGPGSDSKDFNVRISILELPWSQSQDVRLHLSLHLFASAGNDVSEAHASGDFGNTITWGGITQIYDENRSPIDMGAYEITALGSDGFDYAKAAVVPLPAAGWLFGTALAVLSVTGGRRLRR
ncbi:MAG: hypothetical protein D6786_06775 [Gammaproteobacteria bacterium]|nr:MAG: hypothetical protein D6786_06775 [Gammaproteobacteria bacterium]